MVKEKQVLIVDDETLLLETIADMLPGNITVYTAETEAAAFNIISTKELDAVICDISLGSGNGLKLLQRCRAQHINVPFVMITGDATKENAINAFRFGANDIIEKPISPDYFDTQFLKVVDEGYSLRRIREGMGQVQALVGRSKPGETDFIRDYLAMVEANRLAKKAV